MKPNSARRRGTWIAIAFFAVLLICGFPSPADANPFGRIAGKAVGKGARTLVTKVGGWLGGVLAAYPLTQLLDYVTGEDFRSQAQVFQRQLETSMTEIVTRMAESTGRELQRLQQDLDLVRHQWELLSNAINAAGADIEALQVGQSALLATVEELEARATRLEGRVDGLEGRVDTLGEAIDDLTVRVDDLEIALIGECLDRRAGTPLGAGGFLVGDRADDVLVDELEDPELSLWVRLFLDTCTADLTARGVLIQVGLVTHSLEGEMSAYATLKNVAALAAGAPIASSHRRFEYPLRRPSTGLVGELSEFFLPYGEVAFLSSGRLALALVVTHDGQPRYALADRVMSCYEGQTTDCRWGR